MDGFQHCQSLVREFDKDRFLTTLFAPERYREPLYALYAFNIETARVRELVRDPLAGEIRLQWWRDVVSGERDGEARAHPVASALLDTISAYDLPRQPFDDMIEARTLDLAANATKSSSELEEFSEQTSVQLMTLAAMVLSSGGAVPGTGRFVPHAGKAYAITGILRAFAAHAAQGKCYVPVDVLERHGASLQDVFGGISTPGIVNALREIRQLARRHLDAARADIGAVPAAIMPAVLPAALIGPALARMDGKSYDPFTSRDLPQWRRQWVLWRAARRPLSSLLGVTA